MGLAQTIERFVPALSIDGPTNVVRVAWDRLHALPGGARLFTRIVGEAAPYTGTMGARVVELRDGYCRTVLPDRHRVRNHLRSIHAIALCNLAELTANAAMAYSLPDEARFIVAGLSIEYLKKARGDIEGEATCEVPESAERLEYAVPVTMRDRQGEVVATAVLRTLVGPKKRR
jgi:uncharacterized protein (TIGR00369 family)